jgi:hypothetical protein
VWLAWTANGAVSVARAEAGGRPLGPARVIGRHGTQLDTGADARPQLVVDRQGRITLAYGVFKDRQWNAQVMVSTSQDEGTTFTAPRSLSANGTSQRFPTLMLDADGQLLAAWLDKRTAMAARAAGLKADGAALFYAWSADGGLNFGPERMAADGTCECCRLAVALAARHQPLFVYRKLYDGGIRDHAMLALDEAGATRLEARVARDDWRLEGCPHHGPAVAVTDDGRVHAAWFTQGSVRQGLFHARADGGGTRFSEPVRVGLTPTQAGRPALTVRGQRVWLLWKAFDGERIRAAVRSSADGGLTWSADRWLASTAGPADHPTFVEGGPWPWVSWSTRNEGHQLFKLEQP